MKDQYQISQDLVNDLKQIIDNGRQQVVTQANSALVLVIGKSADVSMKQFWVMNGQIMVKQLLRAFQRNW